MQDLILRSAARRTKPKQLREVRSMGEILSPDLRRLCQQEWGVPIHDNYSCEELGTMALQCPEHDHLHVQSEHVLLEVLDARNRPCSPGEMGRVVVTGLLNFATPLIRYELGDWAIVGGPCSCGRGLPVMRRIVGRERQSVTLPTGDRLFPVLDVEPLLLKAGVRQYRLVQRSVDEIDLKVKTKRRLSASEEAGIRKQLQANFQHAFRFNVLYVDAIPRGPGGKFQIFVSDLG